MLRLKTVCFNDLKNCLKQFSEASLHSSIDSYSSCLCLFKKTYGYFHVSLATFHLRNLCYSMQLKCFKTSLMCSSSQNSYFQLPCFTKNEHMAPLNMWTFFCHFQFIVSLLNVLLKFQIDLFLSHFMPITSSYCLSLRFD